MNIGKNKETFEIFLKEEYFKNDILIENNFVEIEIIDTPKVRYNKWYYRILSILTFKMFFYVRYTYTIKVLKNESRNN